MLKLNLETKKAVLFDFDGLMVNSEEVIYLALKELFHNYRRNLSWEYYVTHIGKPTNVSLPAFYRDISIPITFDEFIKERERIVANYLSTHLRPMPGLIDLLTLINNQNKILAISTSAHRAYVESVLYKFNLSNFFSHITSIEDVTKGKPDPDIFIHTLAMLNIKENQAVVLEDSPSGIEASSRAKIESIAIPTKGVNKNLFYKATCVVNSLYEVVDLFKKIG